METISRLNPLLEVLKASPERVNKVFVQNERGPNRLGEVIREARLHGIPVVFVPKSKLDQECAHHQGAMAVLSPRGFASLEEVLSASKVPFLVLLDEIEDPQNMGAIIRTAECAGVDGLIIPEHRSAGLTETVSTVAAGALEHMKVARVVNLARTMERSRSAAFGSSGPKGAARRPGTPSTTPFPSVSCSVRRAKASAPSSGNDATRSFPSPCTAGSPRSTCPPPRPCSFSRSRANGTRGDSQGWTFAQAIPS